MTHIVLLGAVCALFAFIYFLRRFSTAWSMREWRRIEGRVVRAEMRREKHKTPDGCLLYAPVLRYSYSVGGQTFEGTRFTHQAMVQPLSWQGSAMAALTCALLLILLAAILWLS